MQDLTIGRIGKNLVVQISIRVEELHILELQLHPLLQFDKIWLLYQKSHSQIQVDAEILSIDSQVLTAIQLDNKKSNYLSYEELPLCGNSAVDYLYIHSKKFFHNRRTAQILVVFQKGGLIKLKLSIINCQYQCSSCIENYPILCLQWRFHKYQFDQKFITNTDGWTGAFSSSTDIFFENQFLRFQVINYLTQLPPHNDVLIRFHKGDSNSITINYQYNKQIIISGQYQQELLIKSHYDSTLKLEIICPGCYSLIRDFEVLYNSENIRFDNWSEGCLEKINDQCIICQEGWIQDQLLQSCNPICGDKIIQGQEFCDDGNSIPYDGCFNCKYSCCEFCIDCQFGICQQCQDGFFINQNFLCDPICGEGIVIPYSKEQCDLEKVENQDDCQDCRFISINHCKKNYFNYCFECEKGYRILENICYPHCGDNIVLDQYEDCDDGNLEPYDGCNECKFQCSEDCNICERGKCILNCGDGYEFVIGSCHSICGDQITTKEEDCDDGNSIQFDGCFNCKYSCPQSCQECFQGICLQCDNQFYLLDSNICKQPQKCGDGFLQENEQCDDGNDQVVDGCNNCVVQIDFICDTITMECAFARAPNLIINYQNMTRNKQYISLQFDQQVKIESFQPLSETIVLELINVNQTNWKNKMQILQDVGSDASFGKYILEIEANFEGGSNPKCIQFGKCLFDQLHKAGDIKISIILRKLFINEQFQKYNNTQNVEKKLVLLLLE